MTYPTEPLPLRRQRDNLDRERLAEQSFRKHCAKHKGRNHWRNWERRQMLLAKQRENRVGNAIRDAARSRYTAAVRSYWLGLRPTHP